MSDSPINITAAKISKLRDFIDQTFGAFDKNGNIDLDLCSKNVAYNIGSIYTNINGLLLQEKQKLATIQEQLSVIKDKAYMEIKTTKLPFDTDSNGIKIKLEGHVEVAAKQREYDQQDAYVKFLDNTLKQITNYSNGVKTMLQREELRFRYGT